VRFYANDLWIECRPVVHEVDSCRRGLVTQHESRVSGVSSRATRPAIQSHREQQCREKRHRHDGASNARISWSND
jgi:hypothetical protein